MTLKTTEAFITKVSADHTIQLPAEMPVGTTIIVTVVPESEIEEVEEERHARFAATLEAIRRSYPFYEAQPPISDDELDALIERARKSKPL
jgi:hypothetical protein